VVLPWSTWATRAMLRSAGVADIQVDFAGFVVIGGMPA
jgi:hypothetical protein